MPKLIFDLVSRLLYFWKDFHLFIIFYFVFILLFLLSFLFITKRVKYSWRRTLFINLVIFLFLITDVFYAFEVYYRYFFDQTDNVFQMKTTQRWAQKYVALNGFGFRDEHFFDEKDPREIRIAVFGDSHTYGYGIKEAKDRYADLLEKKLDEHCQQIGKRVKVYTFALPGMSSKDHAQLIRKYVPKFKIDAVVLGYYMDDASSEVTPRHIYPCYNRVFAYRHLPIIKDLIKHSYAVEYFYVRFYSRFIYPRFTNKCWRFTREKQYNDPELWIRHLKRLKEIIDFAKWKEVALGVVIIPYAEFIGPNYPIKEVHWRLSQFLEENRIPFSDLLPVFSQYEAQELMVNAYDFHINELAHRLAAEEIYEKIKDLEAFDCSYTSQVEASNNKTDF